MAQQVVNVGSAPNDGTGDTVRNGMIKINNNFTEIYTTYNMTGMLIVGNSTVNASISNAVGYYFGNSTATFTANNSKIAITNFSVNSSLVNAAANVNIGGLLDVAEYLFVNSTVLTVNGSANAASFTVGSDLVGNASGVYHTGVINAASHTVGSSLIGNSTGIYHTGTINSASHTVGSNFVANSTGAYHSGTVNAASHTVGTSTIANSTGVFTGTVNGAVLQVGGKLVVNSSQFSFGSALPVEANGTLGTAGQYLTSDGGAKVYWSSPGVASVNTAGYFIWSNTHIFNKDIQANTVNAVSVTVGNFVVNSSYIRIPNSLSVEANGGLGSAGQLLTTNGSSVYWSSVPGVNTNASYTWNNTAIFSANAIFAANVITNNNLYVSGPAYVSNISTFSSNITIQSSASVNVAGGATFTNNINFTANIAVSNSVFTGTETHSGPATFSANVNFSGGTYSTAGANVLSQTLTDASTISWNTSLGQVASVTLGGNRIVGAPTNLKVGTYILHVIQDGAGNRTLTWNSVFKWTAGVAPVLTTDPNARDIVSFICDGTNLYGSYLMDVK